MTETPEPHTEPTAVGSGVTRREGAAAAEAGAYARHSRLVAVAAWVGIVAGTVFIVAVIFFSGFVLGRHAGGGHHGGHHHWQGTGMSHHGGPPMAPWRSPGGPGGMGPGGPGNPYGPGGTQAPTTAPSATPHP
ncbi:MAG: hypothetical protein JO044_04160 [Mycobacteriaceae bacterium]|nr:hypothetical protein [Mycobacteriaceae bacterium]MBV9638610.1 hypothetical protein [Mycobacteriaceae bacterium]